MLSAQIPEVRTSSRAIIRRGDQYLVIRCQDEQGDWFVFPGGGQQHGEDLHQALLREVHEETGAMVAVGPLRFVRECIAARNPSGNLPSDIHQLELFFECSLVAEPVGLGTVPDRGQLGVEWLSLVELHRRRFFPSRLLARLGDTGASYIGVC